jgi:hypothetical protein
MEEKLLLNLQMKWDSELLLNIKKGIRTMKIKKYLIFIEVLKDVNNR